MGTNKSGSELDFNKFEERVLETVKSCEQRKEPPLVWAMEVAKCVLGTEGLGLPSAELAQVVVSQLCFSNNQPSLWKFLHQALSSALLCPLHVLSLLTSRAIPHRWSQPGVYRLYLELLSRYALSYDPLITDACRVKITKSVDVTLQLSQTYNMEIVELGQALVLSFFSIIVRLVDSISDDWGLRMKTTVDGASGIIKSDPMDVDSERNHNNEIITKNSFMALEVLGKLTDNERAVVLLRLVHLNMPEKFDSLLKRIQTLEAHKLPPSNKNSTSQLLSRLSQNIQKALIVETKQNKRHLTGILTDIGSCKPSSSSVSEASWFACWVPFDICMENVMDGKQFPVTSAIDILSETISTLQVFNRASWQETFLALWLSALRLVQRERDPLEGPIPHLEARLCVLLSITPLAIAHVLENDSTCSMKQGLISSLQVLGQYQALLCPPISVASAANTAAGKAASFISKANSNTTSGANGDTRAKAGGDMRHLIVEACIARKLIDTSAYFWPGYVSQLLSLASDQSTLPIYPWSTFMEGAPLTGQLVNALITTPASSLAEIEKIYHVALNGSEEEKSTAAKILCCASLTRGWNIQEHVVHFVVKLLCPPIPSNFKEPNSHLVESMPMLSAILSAASSVDTVHILSLHGMVPEVAASLMPLCETFGSLVPTPSRKSNTHSESSSSSVYMVFSSAFLFLLRLWKFYKPPLEQCITGRGGWIGGELTLEYLLLLRNSRIANTNNNNNNINTTSDRPIYIDDYPKLRAWYCQNKSCLDSTMSGLLSGNPVHQVANKILTMIYWKMTKSGTPASSNSSSGPAPSASGGEDACQRPMIPAWEVLEAVPYILEAILTACAHGRLSPRDLTTGLRDLVDFLPASLATIISYFSAEVTRGIWKPVSMNGTDWPSPSPNFACVESEIKDILAAAGVTIPTSSSSGVSPAMLPLPMAALVSLTITFKLDKSLEYIHAVAGLALENCASGCPWPGMPIIGSLWAQKVRRWHDFIVVSCSRSVFRQNREAVAQLLRSCFSSFVGSNQSGVNGLLGSFISAQGLRPRVAPGFLYLRSCRTINYVQYVNNVILGLVAEFARESAGRWANAESPPRLNSTQASLAVATARAKEVATLGASLLCVAGGLQLVQELYLETMPTWLLSAREEKRGEGSAVSRIVEGYAMAYFLVLSGAIIWGAGPKQPQRALSRRSYLVGAHMDFVVEVLEGNISLGCDAATWKSYVSCLVGLILSFAPLWIKDVKKEKLRKLANGLRGWHECELAHSLLERGGLATMGYVAELINVI